MAPFLNEQMVPGVKTLGTEVEELKEVLKLRKATEGFPKPSWKPVLLGYKPMSKILESPAGFMVLENMRVWRGLEEEDDDSDWESFSDLDEEDACLKMELNAMESSEGSRSDEDGYFGSGESETTTSEEEKNEASQKVSDGEKVEKPDAKAKKKSIQQKLQGIFKKNIVFPEAYSGKKEVAVELLSMDPIEEEESVEGSSDSMVDVPPACGSLCSLFSQK